MRSWCRKPPWPSAWSGPSENPGRQDPVPGAAGRGTSGPPAAGARGGVPHLQRGLQFQLRWPADPGGPLPGRRSGWAACWPALMPDEPEVTGLLALMLLTESRRPARDSNGGPGAPGGAGPALVGPGPHRRRPGAAASMPAAEPARPVPAPGRDQRRPQRRVRRRSNGLGADSPALRPAPRASRPDPWWLSTGQSRWPSSRARNLLCVVVDALGLEDYYLAHAVRADFLVRLGRSAEAAAAYRCCAEPGPQRGRRTFLEDRLRALDRAGPP